MWLVIPGEGVSALRIVTDLGSWEASLRKKRETNTPVSQNGRFRVERDVLALAERLPGAQGHILSRQSCD